MRVLALFLVFFPILALAQPVKPQALQTVFELAGVASVRGVHVLALRHEPDAVVAIDAAVAENTLERLSG